jgi:hypothetical protein
MDQQRLFTPAPEVIGLVLSWQYPDGWRVRVGVRRSGEELWEAPESYEGLCAAEALDVAVATLEGLLSGADAVAASPPSTTR